MASITSVISFFILLLATYSYSAPVVQEHDDSIPRFEFTTDTTRVERESPVIMELVSDAESTVATNVDHKRRSFDSSREEATTSIDMSRPLRMVEESHSEEATTSIDMTRPLRMVEESHSEEVTTSDMHHALRTVEESHSEEAKTSDMQNVLRTVEDPSSSPSDDSSEKRSIDEFMYTTMETSTDFNRRAIKPIKYQEKVETTTLFQSENQKKLTKEFEPSSSADSFAKSTGLLHDGQTKEHSSTFEHQHHDQSSEESTTRLPVKTTKFVKI